MRRVGQRTKWLTFVMEGKNTKLVKDTRGRLYAQVGFTTPVPIKKDGGQITTNIYYPGFVPIAAEIVSGTKKVLWRYFDGSSYFLHLWTCDANWNWVSSTSVYGMFTPEAYATEVDFQQDFNGDGKIGTP